MTNVRLYYNEPRSYNLLARMLVKKVLPSGGRAVVVTGTEGEAERLNHYLWTFSETSFLPHCLASNENAGSTPVVITDAGRAEGAEIRDYMFVVDGKVPGGCESYPNLVIITRDDIGAGAGPGGLCDDMERRGFTVMRTDSSAPRR